MLSKAFRPAKSHAVRPGSAQSRGCTFLNDRALELSNGHQDVQLQVRTSWSDQLNLLESNCLRKKLPRKSGHGALFMRKNRAMARSEQQRFELEEGGVDLPMNLVASGVSRITSHLGESPPERSEPTHVHCGSSRFRDLGPWR